MHDLLGGGAVPSSPTAALPVGDLHTTLSSRLTAARGHLAGDVDPGFLAAGPAPMMTSSISAGAVSRAPLTASAMAAAGQRLRASVCVVERAAIGPPDRCVRGGEGERLERMGLSSKETSATAS